MADQPKLPPSLWLALALLVLIIGGGGVSVAVQGRQTRDQLWAAASAMTGGDPGRGKTAFGRAGCGACHEIPGVDRADGAVGPALGGIASRAFLAGRLANTPENLKAWIAHPQALEPGNGMPDPAISDRETRDIAAYLYTVK